ncbi:MAG TPA: SRPBCC domain-containing protein [Acidimicrobiia bacterium]|nr:SRPBCC domain-containing protein [Acidimicrobiia bacterium]
MSVTSVHKDPAALTMTITAEYAAPIDRVWQLWADPRKLERWWGPPTYPATFVDHDLTPGGHVSYFMTGPEGDKPRGWWRILSVDAPRRLEFEDGFADDAGQPNPDMPTMVMRVTLDESGGGATRMVIETTFPSKESMEQLITMGMEEGMSSAVGQIDALLAS